MSDTGALGEENRELHEQTLARLRNREALEQAGFAAFPYQFQPSHSPAQLRELHAHAPDAELHVRVAGRVVAVRDMGRMVFATLQDASGQIQLWWRKDEAERFEAVKYLDLGDFVGVEGALILTKTGELTVRVVRWLPLVKSLHPLPSKFHGLRDPEVRARQRYLDLISNRESVEVFRRRSQVIRFIRDFLHARGFLEVEGPTLQAVTGGTEAKPFATYHNALDHQFKLRISLELYLKRLLVGGFDKIFEIGRNYRNEGIDHTHNPEFTMLEFYWAFADYGDMMLLVEELVHDCVVAVTGQTRLQYGEVELDFSRPFQRVDFTTELKRCAGLDFDPTDLERLRGFADTAHPEMRDVPDYKLLDKLFGHYVEPQLQNPTFVVDVPEAISPLVKKHRSKPNLAERADLFVAGVELAPIYSELNDALDQRARFEAQAVRRAAGDDEAHELDEDFLMALEYGMPPAAGMGLGIDRFTMLLTNQHNIRDVLLFPLLKPLRPDEME